MRVRVRGAVRAGAGPSDLVRRQFSDVVQEERGPRTDYNDSEFLSGCDRNKT